MLFLLSFLLCICKLNQTFTSLESNHNLNEKVNTKNIEETFPKLNTEDNPTMFEYCREKILKLLEKESSAEREFAEFVTILEQMNPNTREFIRRYFKSLNYILSLQLTLDKVISLIPKVGALVDKYGMAGYKEFERELFRLIDEEIKQEEIINDAPKEEEFVERPPGGFTMDFSDWGFMDDFE